MKQLLLLLAPLALTGCVTTPPEGDSGLVYARIGQTVTVGGPRVTPLALIEDSRCPQGVQCVWAGQVRISARVATGSSSSVREMTSGKPEPVGYGLIEDGLRFDAEPAFTQPAMIFHGTEDDVVPVSLSRDFIAKQPNASLREMKSGHELTDVMEEIWEESKSFLVNR